jgi:MSHA pilin protein MshD
MPRLALSSRRSQAGLSLIEVVVFIVVFGIALAGVLILYNQLTRASVDPLVRKQALAIASSLMEEIQLQPFTYCDPDDPLVFTATQPIDCTIQEGIGVEGAETRYGNTGPLFLRFDNVSDYDNLTMAGSNVADPNSIRDITNSTIAGLNGYTVGVAVTQIAANELGAAITNTSDALRITVTVTGPANVTVKLQGYRLRYAPNSP